jgi:hypothetical protein
VYDWKIHLEQNPEEHKTNGPKESEVRKEWNDLCAMTVIMNYGFNPSTPVIMETTE